MIIGVGITVSVEAKGGGTISVSPSRAAFCTPTSEDNRLICGEVLASLPPLGCLPAQIALSLRGGRTE
jgi:hypothetical protein